MDKDFFGPLQRRTATWKRIDRCYELINIAMSYPPNNKLFRLVNEWYCEIEELEQSLTK